MTVTTFVLSVILSWAVEATPGATVPHEETLLITFKSAERCEETIAALRDNLPGSEILLSFILGNTTGNRRLTVESVGVCEPLLSFAITR